MWRSDKTKEEGFEILGAMNCGKVNRRGNEWKMLVSNVCLCRPIWVLTLAQNNPYAKVTHLGVAYSAPFQFPLTWVEHLSNSRANQIP